MIINPTGSAAAIKYGMDWTLKAYVLPVKQYGLNCNAQSAHSLWYKLPVLGYQGNHKRRKGQSGNPEFLHVFLGEDGMKKSLYDQVIENAHWWIMSKKRYLYKHPEADLIWFNLCIYEPELIRLIDKGMHQIQNNKGFDINHPLVDLDVPGFNRLMDILMVDRINRFAHFEFVSKGYVIDEFDIKGEADELIKMFNQVMTVENTG